MFKFKSQATAEVILLEASAQQMLKLIGKEPAHQGIITVAQIPGAVVALEAAVRHDEEQPQQVADENADGAGHHAHGAHSVTLRQRTAPFIDMLKRSAAEGKDVVWGV
ncbi:DUF1840 domain-containing protein [Xylophilus ampelinus]|uniref:Uncharacterized protein DUF1840 n=1 Tax=Xylophilus ampelinus TaxID=54067 RepID=A0A318SKL2_9BURK|nr:DUF1840 domain-containing protein [Xylophilus ampelinus]MCS4509559.1 DUF1840 domain-containing protein [Xylophilus ampelinus]PYE78961.1 uncharacterized protein DUF1840 [Xylophilus ampelinus]